MITETRQHNSYLELFPAFEERAAGHDQPWLRSLRQEALERFLELGFPTTHDEDWRFTNVSAIAQTEFRLPERVPEVTAGQAKPFSPTSAAAKLVFVSGRFVPALSQVSGLPKGAKALSLKEAFSSESALLEQHLGRYTDYRSDAFSALNTAFLEDGALILLPRGTVLERPVVLLYLSIGEDQPLMTHPRNLIVAGEECQAEILEEYISLRPGTFFSNSVTEVVAGENSVLSHYVLEREDTASYNVSTLHVQQGRSSNVASHTILLGGALVRNNVHPVLAGEGAECLVNGLFLGTGTQHMDNYMKVEHASPHCDSRQFYNGILDQRAHGVFHGRIIVHPAAQKTDAKQTNRNLLLSDEAQIDTKPQLEIYADDVKCTHGATIGQIDEGALFYLRSRGLSELAARGLLLAAFAGESLDRMRPGPVRDYVEGIVTRSLPQARPPE